MTSKVVIKLLPLTTNDTLDVMADDQACLHFLGAKGAPILFSEIGFCMASCSYIYIIYIYIYIYIYLSRWRRRGVR